MKFPTEEFTLLTVCCVSLSSASYCDLRPFIYVCTLHSLYVFHLHVCSCQKIFGHLSVCVLTGAFETCYTYYG